MRDNPWLERKVLNFAHQGGELEAPSNTLYAFKTAVAKGAHALELDLHATADGEIVICHDPIVDRTTQGSGPIDSLTLAEVKRLDAAWWFVPDLDSPHDASADAYHFRGVAGGTIDPPAGFEPNDFTIPTLREVLETFDNVMINMDIKRSAPDTAPYEATVAHLLHEFGRTDDVIVASFSDTTIQTFRTLAPTVTTAGAMQEARPLARGEPDIPPPVYQALQMRAVRGERVLVTDELVRRAHAYGVAVHPWTVNDEATMRMLVDLGVDGVMSARPTLLTQVLTDTGTRYPV